MINLSEGYAPPLDVPKFELGEVIFYKRYGYRGVIVSIDSDCQAPDDWYQANQTQPNRNQPWYHVLVDGNQQVTYVAQSSIEYDQLGSPVVHPMLNLFFYGHDENENKYLRNEVPWDPGKPPDAPPPTPPPDFEPPKPPA